MKIMTLNVNGLRSAIKKGLYEWLQVQSFDVICLQEIKIQEEHVDVNSVYRLPGYECVYFHAQKKGYSGVAIYSKKLPKQISKGLGFEICDQEGRYLQFDFDDFSVASIYFPSGTSGELRQAAKMQFLSAFEAKLQDILVSKRPYVLCGDYNIAHHPIDLKNWRANQKHSGFLPEERAWLDKLFGHFGLVDVFRTLYPEAQTYTWWSFRGQAWQKNVGWRIDYQVVTPSLMPLLTSAEVYREPKFSDHAPLVVDYSGLNI